LKLIQLIIQALGFSVALGAVFSTQAEIRPGNFTINRSSSETQFRDIELKAEIWESSQEWVRKTFNWTEIYCDYDPGYNGGQIWFDDYLNLPKNMKSSALHRSISGISREQAEAVVYSSRGFLTNRPATWNDFRDEVWRIQESFSGEDISFRTFYWDVIVENGSQNFKKMGYAHPGYSSFSQLSPSSGPENALASLDDKDYNDHGPNPAPAPAPAPAPSPEPVKPSYNCSTRTRFETLWKLESQSKMTGTIPKRVDVTIENSVLLRGERESIHLSWNGQSQQINVDTRYAINSYSLTVDSKGNTYLLKGEGRKAITPSTGDFKATFNYNGGKLTLDVSDSRAEELTKLDPSYQLSVSVTVTKTASGCFGSTKPAGSKVLVFPSGSGSLDISTLLPEAAAAKDTIAISALTFERQNTKYFSGSANWPSALEVQIPKN